MIRLHPTRARGPAILLVVFLVLGLTAVDISNAGKQPGGRSSGPLKLDLDQAVSIAIARNLRMADARLGVDEAEAQRREAFSDFFPTLDLQYAAAADRYRQSGNVSAFGSAHDSRRIPGIPGDPVFEDADYPYRIDPYRTFSMTGTLTQPVFTGGRLLNNYKFAQLGVDFSELDVDLERQDLILDVITAYYQLIQSYRLLDVAKQSIIALESLRNQTQEFYKAGVVPKVDVLSTEGQLAQARIERTQSQTDIERFTARLNQLLRFPQGTHYDVDENIDYHPNPYRIPDIYATAAANRVELRQADISVQQAMALVKSAQADLMPAVSVQVRGSRTNDDWNPWDREAINDWSLQGVLTWTFDMFRTRETVRERRSTYARTFVAREQLVDDIMEEVTEAYYDMVRAAQDISDNRKAVEFRSEEFRINKERYKEQVATYVEVLDAQRELARAQGDYYISLIEYRINRAVLERRMGILR